MAKKKKDDRRPNVTSVVNPTCSEKLNLSRKQFLIRKKKTLSALRPIHISTAAREDNKPVLDGLWTTLVCTASKPDMTNYITNSNICMHEIIPNVIKSKLKDYERSKENQVRSMRVLYEGGLISKRKYTSIRNSSDVVKETDEKRKNSKTEFMKGCEVPKVLPYKTVMSFIRNIDIGELLSLESLAAKLSVEAFPGVYRPLKPFLLRLADLCLFLDSKSPCLHWFNGEKGVMYRIYPCISRPFMTKRPAQKIALDLYTSHTQRPYQAIQEISITIARSSLGKPSLQNQF